MKINSRYRDYSAAKAKIDARVYEVTLEYNLSDIEIVAIFTELAYRLADKMKASEWNGEEKEIV
jgi:hypothetical protein